MVKTTFRITFEDGETRSLSANILEPPKSNILIFIETNVDRLEALEKNSKPMDNWRVIYAVNTVDANEQFQNYIKREKIVENLIIRTHGGGGKFLILDTVPSENSDMTSEEDLEYENIIITGLDLRNFNHSKYGTREFLTSDEMGYSKWREEKYDALEALSNLKLGLTEKSKVCFSGCTVGKNSDLGYALSILFDGVEILINNGLGGTSGTLRNKSKGEFLSLLLPGYLSTEKTRGKGFTSYIVNADGRFKKNIGEVKLNDNDVDPLETPLKN